VRLLGGIILAVLVLMLYYMLVEYVPFMLKSAAQAVAYNEYIAPPNASQYFPYFLIILAAFVAGYVAYRERY